MFVGSLSEEAPVGSWVTRLVTSVRSVSSILVWAFCCDVKDFVPVRAALVRAAWGTAVPVLPVILVGYWQSCVHWLGFRPVPRQMHRVVECPVPTLSTEISGIGKDLCSCTRTTHVLIIRNRTTEQEFLDLDTSRTSKSCRKLWCLESKGQLTNVCWWRGGLSWGM